MGFLDRFRKSDPEERPAPELGALCLQLTHGEWEQRAAAAEALGDLGRRAEAAVPALEQAICDEHGDVCLAASSALSRIRAAAH